MSEAVSSPGQEYVTPVRPSFADAAVVRADGTLLWGRGVGAAGAAAGEVVFNTSITGYQEVMTDPSYAGQILTFTFPHIGNVGTNVEDLEAPSPVARGCILRGDISEPSNWRSSAHLDDWLKASRMIGVSGIDTRALTRRIRDRGAPNGVVAHAPGDGASLDPASLLAMARAWPGSEGQDMAKQVTCREPYSWEGTLWSMGPEQGSRVEPRFRVVAVDFGAKRNILRSLASAGCAVTVVPASASADEIMAYRPDGVFLSNGPGDPAATGQYVVPVVQSLLSHGVPIFGICLGHQILALALGARTYKMAIGHRGANQPVKDLGNGRVEITSQNHGFGVDRATLPSGVVETHVSLFDGSVEGLRVVDRPVFSVQYHPEASPGPQDSHYLFQRFVDMMAVR
ncbi:MAG: glutamine-hydrolyzing carbamoyl-phosphate synthase small subunit [Alphaproteobacteria bacterium]